ncbi:20753_t:CDS:2, partial [Rhizophagus irregularis]
NEPQKPNHILELYDFAESDDLMDIVLLDVTIKHINPSNNSPNKKPIILAIFRNAREASKAIQSFRGVQFKIKTLEPLVKTSNGNPPTSSGQAPALTINLSPTSNTSINASTNSKMSIEESNSLLSYPQNEKQDFTSNFSEQLKQISQLNQEKNNLQDQLAQSASDIQELKFQQDQYKSQLIQSQINYKKIDDENLKLEKIAETYYQVSQNELKEMISAYQNIKLELVNLKLQNFQLEQNYQDLRFNLTAQIREFAEKENTLQTLITCLQNEKQALAGNLTEHLKQNKLTNQQIQIQTNQQANIQELKSQQENLIEQKEQLENQLNQFQANYEQIKQEKIRLHNVVIGLSQDQKLTTKLKAKLEKEIAQFEQKLLIDKRKELSEIEKELINKLTCGENTKEIHKEKEAKQKEMNELKQELESTSASYNANRKKQVLNQVNNFLKTKGDFLISQEEAIKKLQNCCNRLEIFTNKERIAFGFVKDMVSVEDKISKIKFADKYTKEFQNILTKYNDGLLQLNKKFYSLRNIVQENKELEVSLEIENILKLDFFNLDKYKIFKFATNSQEGTRTQLNSSMMAEDIDSLRKNLNKLKSEIKQEKKELKNLATD